MTKLTNSKYVFKFTLYKLDMLREITFLKIVGARFVLYCTDFQFEEQIISFCLNRSELR